MTDEALGVLITFSEVLQIYDSFFKDFRLFWLHFSFLLK